MFQGTGSGVGKSLATAALCRVLARRGVKVAPFKAQNMALNSFVTHDGLEMGRAQAYQAEACGLLPDARMNPVLLKPTGDARSQVILMGRARGHYSAREYYLHSDEHRQVAREAFDSLGREFDCIVMEGAGSPAEINLQDRDIVNMEMAAYADSPVIIVGDIDRGGVFAWIKGTYDLVPRRHRRLVKGYVVNKFRGDRSLLAPGISGFKELVDLHCIGVLPWFDDIEVDQEDGVFVKELEKGPGDVRIAVVHLPRISNFTDFAPLAFEPDVSLRFVRRPGELGDIDCLVIPGTKATRADLRFLVDSGWDEAVRALAAGGKTILGICGGYQMLGLEITDPGGVEGPPGTSGGLGLLPVATEMSGTKHLSQTRAVLRHPALTERETEVTGYEIHAGRTRAAGDYVPLGPGIGPGLGCASTSAETLGVYLHGLFENDELRHHFVNRLRVKKGLSPVTGRGDYKAHRKRQFDRLADWFEENTDLPFILRMLNL